MNLDSASLESLLSPIAEGLGYILWGVEFRSSEKHALLKVFIDSENGITADDCSAVSHQISGLLDVEDPIDVPYTLEVSSPGLARPLMKMEHFERYKGSLVKVRLSWAINERKNLVGNITQVGGEDIAIEMEGETIEFPFNAIKRANLIFS